MTRAMQVYPSVVKANCETEITIASFDGLMLFYDDVEYKIQFVPMEEFDTELDPELRLHCEDNGRKTICVKPQNGVIRVKYFFIGEQEWTIRIWTDDYQAHFNDTATKWGWNWINKVPERGRRAVLYSVKEDLYERRPYKCDFHAHTNRSDGAQPPAVAAACYRRRGYDVLALTDHGIYNTASEIKDSYDAFKTSFELMTAEEVHNGYNGYFHMVSLGGSYGVSRIFREEPERVKAEVAELEKTVTVPEGLDKNEYLQRVWMYREIKKSGGLAIHVHPCWRTGDTYHCQTAMNRAIFENGLCDAFEVIGDNKTYDNNLQSMLFFEERAKGGKFAFIGATDCHDMFDEKGTFGRASTIVFADEKGILPAIYDDYSVAVESNYGEGPRVYGEYRMIKYAQFLLRHYYPIRDSICFSQGDMMLEYFTGGAREELAELITKSESRLGKYDKEFFNGKI